MNGAVQSNRSKKRKMFTVQFSGPVVLIVSFRPFCTLHVFWNTSFVDYALKTIFQVHCRHMTHFWSWIFWSTWLFLWPCLFLFCKTLQRCVTSLPQRDSRTRCTEHLLRNLLLSRTLPIYIQPRKRSKMSKCLIHSASITKQIRVIVHNRKRNTIILIFCVLLHLQNCSCCSLIGYLLLLLLPVLLITHHHLISREII